MVWTAPLEGIEAQLAEDARATAKALERVGTVPTLLEPRIRAMFRELVETHSRAVQAGAVADLALYLSEPVQVLNRLLERPRLDAPDDRDQVRLACLAVAQAVERYQEGAGVWSTLPLHELLAWLVDALMVSKQELAGQLGVSSKTISRWATQATTPQEDEARVRNLARLVAQLRSVYTPRGTMQWLSREIPAKAGRRPLDLLDDDQEVRDLEESVWRFRGA